MAVKCEGAAFRTENGDKPFDKRFRFDLPFQYSGQRGCKNGSSAILVQLMAPFGGQAL
jgi:hypothetical protein